MNYQQAVAAYQAQATKEVLHEQVRKLTGEMTLKEKIYMLSGHPLAQIQKDMIAKCVAAVFVIVGNYVLSKLFVFRKAKTRE